MPSELTSWPWVFLGGEFDCNPMRFVRQGAKRRSAPDVLTASEIRTLIDHLALRERTLVLLAASTGLRQSELFGLKWRDVDFEHGELSVVRSIAFGVIGRCKTESSQKPVPLLGEALFNWRKTCKFTGCDDWIFASRLHKGRSPYLGACILRKYIRPVAHSLEIQKRIGWHTFRHTYSTLLRSVGAEFKVMQELMRHSTLRTTMDVYTQAVAPAKHAAQAAVLALFFPMTSSEEDDVILALHSNLNSGCEKDTKVWLFCTREYLAKVGANHSFELASPTGFEPVLSP